MPKICILDAITLGEDADLSAFQGFGEVIVHDTTESENVVERIKDCEIIITKKLFWIDPTCNMHQSLN